MDKLRHTFRRRKYDSRDGVPTAISYQSSNQKLTSKESKEPNDNRVLVGSPSPYRAPRWFLAYNVKTIVDLRNSKAKISVTATAPFTLSPSKATADGKASGDHAYKYEIESDIFSELRDITAAALLPDRIWEESYSKQPSILLRAPVRGAFDFLESMIEQLARDIGASLISVDLDDLADIALEFSGQGGKPTNTPSPYELAERFFGVYSGTPRRDAASAILDAAKLKMESQKPSDEELNLKSSEPSPPVFLHIRDAKRIMALKNGPDILSTFRTVVQGRRKINQLVILFVTILVDKSGPQESDDTTQQLHENIYTDSTSIVTAAPPKTEKYEALLVAEDARCTQEAIFRQLKRTLRVKLRDGFDTDLLVPRPPWAHSRLATFEASALWPEEMFDRAARQIIGRTWGKSALELGDIIEVVTRINQTVTASAVEERKEEKSAEFRDGDNLKTAAFKERLDKNKARCNEYEKEILSCVIDPANLRVTLDEVIMQQEVKDAVKQLISLNKFQPAGNTKSAGPLIPIRISGALLYGPPGTGKTHLGRAIAKECGATMINVSSADVISKWTGGSEKYIKALFSLSAKLWPCVVFIDEGEVLFCGRPSSDRSWERSAINQFLLEMDGLATKESSPFVLVATNRPMDLDEAFLRRLPQKIYFPLPNESGRAQILKRFLKEQNMDPLLTVEVLANQTDRFSGSDLRTLCGQAALVLANEDMSTQESRGKTETAARPKLGWSHFAIALKRTKPSVSRLMVENFKEFQRRFNS